MTRGALGSLALPQVIGEGKRALPVAGRLVAGEGFEDRGGVFVGERIGGDAGLVVLELVGGDAFGVGKSEGGGDAGSGGVAGVDGKELDGATLDGGVGAPGAVGIDVAAEVAVVGGVGVDEDAFGSVVLGDVGLDAAEVFAVTDDDDLVFDADAEFGELLEVGEGAVVGVDDLGGDVTGWGRAVEGGKDAGIVLEGVAAILFGVDVFGGGTGHELVAGCVEGFDEDLYGSVEENFVGDDLGLETGGFEFVGDVLSGLVVFRGAGPMGLGSESFEVLAGEFGVGDGHEGLVPLGLLGEVAVAEDLGGGGLSGGDEGQEKEGGKGMETSQRVASSDLNAD